MDIKTVNDYKRPSTSVMEFPSKKEEDLPYGDIILVEKPGDVPETILKHSVGICGRNLKWTYTKLDNSCGYTIYINSNKVAFASDCDKQFAKNAASAIALDRLRKYYHTIKVKQNLNTQTNATLTTIKETKSQNVIHNDNAQRLMKLIGWSCEYLRNSEQGIMEPVMFEQLTRKDLGLKSCPSSPSNICELKAKCKIIFKKLLMGDIQNDIVFSMDFTNKEKEKMLQIARSMCLKSYIDCSSDQWKLVILHKVNIQSLLEKLKSLAGTTKTYELIQPTGLDDELDIVDGTIEKYESIESTSLDEKVKDPEHSIEKYESIKPTSLVEDTRCIAQTSIITEKAITNKINKKLKSEIEETETLNNDKKCSNSVMESLCKKKNLYGDIILVEKPGDVPEIILKHSVGTSNKNLKCEYTKIYNSWNYVVSINSKQVACASDCSRKRAKKAVLALALDELRKYYYTIKIKQNSDAQMNITLMTIKKLKSENIIPDDNIGKKLLKLMGWSGGGLGKSQQGIMEPVMFVQHFGRKGLGLKSSSSNIEYQELKAQCKIIFQKLLMGDIQKDIVFSTDFTNDEKTVIDEVARLMALKSRSHGPSDQRKLVISRKINIRTLFQELKSGRSNEKYELIEPTHLDDELDSVNGTTENYELTESTSLDAEVKDFEGTTEKYRESIEPTNLVEELDQKEPISNNQSNNKLQFEVQGTKTINNHKKSNASVMESPSKEKKDSPYGDIILVEKPGDVPETILKHSVGLCDANLKCIQTKLSESCTIYINSKQIACVSDCSRKRAREVVFALALDELRKYYHTIKIKQNPDPQKNATLMKTEKLQTKMFDDNVEKLMKLIGWSHDSLRKSQQSIMESVTLQQQLSRESLGLKLSPPNKHELKAKCKIIFNKLLEEDKQNNIIFSTDFTVQEKKKIRKIVRLMGLKSCSYSSEQKLVILGRINIRNLFEELKSLAGTTEKYELIEPTNLDNKLDNIDGTTEVDSPSLDEEVKDLKEITEKYELTKPTSLVEELDKTCISQTSTIIDYKPVSDKTNKKLKSEIVDTETVSEHKCSSTSIMESSSKDTKDLLYGDIILVEKMGDIPRNTLTHSIGISNKNLRWEYTRFCNACKCTIYINSRQVACASDCTRRRAREAAFALALDELRKYYYTIKIKQNTDAQNVTLTTIEETMSQDNIRDGNIGEKLIKLMGRNGDRLRRSLQSMKKRVTLEQQLSRESLGLTSSSFSICELKAKCKITFEKFLIGDMQNNIVFSMDFTNYEKLIIHQVANSVGLESRNRGSHNQQELIISRKLNILSLVEELKSLGGTTKKYELIKPINLNDEMENIDGTTEKYKLTGLTNYEEMKN